MIKYNYKRVRYIMQISKDIVRLIVEQLGKDLQSIAHFASVCKQLRLFICEIGMKDIVQIVYIKSVVSRPLKYVRIDDDGPYYRYNSFFPATIATHIHHRIYEPEIQQSLMYCANAEIMTIETGYPRSVITSPKTYSIEGSRYKDIYASYLWPCQPKKLRIINPGSVINVPESVADLEFLDNEDNSYSGDVYVSGLNLSRILCRFNNFYYKQIKVKDAPQLKTVEGYVGDDKETFVERYTHIR